jgi:hypothetical protein
VRFGRLSRLRPLSAELWCDRGLPSTGRTPSAAWGIPELPAFRTNGPHRGRARLIHPRPPRGGNSGEDVTPLPGAKTGIVMVGAHASMPVLVRSVLLRYPARGGVAGDH